MLFCYAIIPEGDELPSALFMHFEDAMDWGSHACAGKGFRIRYLEVAQIEKDDLGFTDLRS